MRKMLGFPEKTDNLSFDEIVSAVSNYYEKLISKMPGHVYWLDEEGRTAGCNQNVLDSFGLSSIEEFIGLSYDQQREKVGWSAEATASFEADTFEVIKTGKAKMNVEEPPVQDREGKTVYFLTSRVPVLNQEKKVIAVVGISTDITELKHTQNELIEAKEKAETANKSKTEFVQNMQHDIRTPTSGLWGVLDVLAKGENDPNKKAIFDMAVTASKRLLDLCNEAVEFGDLSGNTRPQLAKPFDIRALARSIIELNLPAAFSKDLTIHFNVDSTVPAHIVSDEFRVSRILINLLGNAVKFSHKGEITLSINATLDEDNPRKSVLTIEVKDQGIGIPQDKINHVFEKFTRGVASNTNQYPGTGLGLYVVKTFIDELDGDIWVESHENEGAYFKLILPFKVLWEDIEKPGRKINEHFYSPLKEAEKEENLHSKLEKEFSGKTPFSHDIFIIEDDKTCLFAEKNLLSSYTSKIDSAENVADALKKLAAKRYDLVISDLGLPDGSGNDIVAKIKASPESPNYKTPFVAMTAHKDAAKHKQAMDAGFLAIGTKPLSTDKAIEFLKTYPHKGTAAEPEQGNLAIIDLALGMQRIGATTESNAIEALGILHKTLQEDIPILKEAQKNNDIVSAREILHKIRGGLYYSGTPRLEEAFQTLHAEVKLTPDLAKIESLFSSAYNEVKLFADELKKLVRL